MIPGGITGLESAYPQTPDDYTARLVTNGIDLVDASLWNSLADSLLAMQRYMCITGSTTGGSLVMRDPLTDRYKAVLGQSASRIFKASATVTVDEDLEVTSFVISAMHVSGAGIAETPLKTSMTFTVETTAATSQYPLTVAVSGINTYSTTASASSPAGAIVAVSEITCLMCQQIHGWNTLAPAFNLYIPQGQYKVGVIGMMKGTR